MIRSLCHLVMAAAAATVALASCVPALPGELDPGATGAAGTSGVAGSGSATGGSIAPGGSAVNGAAATSGPIGDAGQGGGAGTPVMCDPQCVPTSDCRDQATPMPSSISTFESACTAIDPVDGRDGAWFVWAGGTSVVSPDPAQPFRVSCVGTGGSCFSACVSGTLSGSGYPSVILGVALRRDARAYDASAYEGVVFSVLGIGLVAANSEFRFKVPLAADTMVGNGDGTCTTGCFDAYATPLMGSGPNGRWAGWEKREIRFSDLRQAGWGAPEPWDPTTVISLQWEISAKTETVTGIPFMFCVDQVGLVPR